MHSTITILPSCTKPLNGEASNIKIELFNDIHGDSAGYLHQMISSVSLQKRLAIVGFTGTFGIQSHPPTHRVTGKQAANDIHDLHNSPNHGIYGRHSQGKVGQSFSTQFSFSLPISELLSHISVLVLLCSTL